MSKIVSALKSAFAEKILAASETFGQHEVLVAPADWKAVARFVRDDDACQMNHFIDLTAIDWPERAPEKPRFDVVLLLRSLTTKERIRIRTRTNDKLDSLVEVWVGADWAEREVWDMFGIKFEGHPDLRRILMYDEFEGFPLRKDYPIEKAQPLVPYRAQPGLAKLPPFGSDMGQPWGRVDWSSRLEGQEHPVSPSIAEQSRRSQDLANADDGKEGR